MNTVRESSALSVQRSLWRVAFVVIFASFAILINLPDVVLPWHPTAILGFLVDGEANVVDVTPGLSAARAGIVAGDTVDLADTPLRSRAYLLAGTPNDVRPGQHIPIVFWHDGKRRPVDIVGHAANRSLADNATNLLLVASDIALPLIGAFLLLKRPSRMTWAFFLYCVANTSGFAVTTIAYIPPPATIAIELVTSLYQIPWLWLILFALRFPNDAATGWRARVELGVLISLVVILPINIWVADAYIFALAPPPGFVAALSFVAVAGLLVAGAIFVVTYIHAIGRDRARIRWVMFGLVTGFTGQLTFQIGSSLPGVASAWPIWLSNLAQASEILIPITVTYAIVRHRVFDVRFFIGRAVVYGILTTAMVMVLALVDYVAGKILAGTGLATIGEAGAAIVIGLSLNGVHKRLEHLIDATLFRSRIVADRRLRRIGRGLGHATSVESIERIAVHEPFEALRLASAAIFRRNEDGRFVRGDAIGWEGVTTTSIERDDPLVLQLLASKERITSHDITMPTTALPGGRFRPAVAMPILIRSSLEAIVLYGPHESEEDLDPGELETLEFFLQCAASAYDHVRAEAAIRNLKELEARFAALVHLNRSDFAAESTSRSTPDAQSTALASKVDA